MHSLLFARLPRRQCLRAGKQLPDRGVGLQAVVGDEDVISQLERQHHLRGFGRRRIIIAVVADLLFVAVDFISLEVLHDGGVVGGPVAAVAL